MKYYIDHNTLDPKLVDISAEEFAKSFFLKDKKDKRELNSSQLRKFYADVKSLERQWQAYGSDEATSFARILPMIKLLKAKSEYALKRNVVSENFKNWLWDNIDSINSARDFKAFLLHFEAVVGFSARYTKD